MAAEGAACLRTLSGVQLGAIQGILKEEEEEKPREEQQRLQCKLCKHEPFTYDKRFETRLQKCHTLTDFIGGPGLTDVTVAGPKGALGERSWDGLRVVEGKRTLTMEHTAVHSLHKNA
jgi:hypothetical protein